MVGMMILKTHADAAGIAVPVRLFDFGTTLYTVSHGSFRIRSAFEFIRKFPIYQ